MMFGEVKDGQMLLSEYGTVVKTILERTNQAYSNLALVCYTVMPNHIHMLVRIEDCLNNRRAAEGSRPYNAAASTFIHALKTLTTKKLGFSLWQRSYYDNIIHDDDEYETVKRYIENNAPTWEKDRFYCAH
jgi:REP element-mobilizing transposase RayT